MRTAGQVRAEHDRVKRARVCSLLIILHQVPRIGYLSIGAAWERRQLVHIMLARGDVHAQSDPSRRRPSLPARTEKLPERVEQVDAAWLTRLLQNRYPGLVVENMEVLKLINTHTTKMRLALDFNRSRPRRRHPAAGVPESQLVGQLPQRRHHRTRGSLLLFRARFARHTRRPLSITPIGIRRTAKASS